METIFLGLSNCVNLQACTWTRDGSLRDGVLRSLQSCMHLRSLTFNGRSEGVYDEKMLLNIKTLQEISVIMPSQRVLDVFLPWINTLCSLKSLTFICKSSPRVTDTFLESISLGCSRLEHLRLVGCIKITYRGVLSILSASTVGLSELSLEGLSPNFDLAAFVERCRASNALRRLKAITLTLNQQRELEETTENIVSLVADVPLERFQIYSVGAVVEAPLTQTFWARILDHHAARLTRLSVHRMLISLDVIEDICLRCDNLDQLFVVVEPEHLDQLALGLASARKLRALHINFPLEAQTDEPPVISPTKALSIVNHCSSTLTQFGCNTRVWQVEREVTVDAEGTLVVSRHLRPYNSPDIPEQFLVVHT
ncbi:hypothetical protein HGRIS_012315 [Hohenbuehelia grisea]